MELSQPGLVIGIVEADPGFRRALLALITVETGAKVIAGPELAGVLAELGNRQPRLWVLGDNDRPGARTAEVLSRLTTGFPESPVLVICGSNSVRDRDLAGAAAVVRKPIDAEEFAGELRNLLAFGTPESLRYCAE